MLFDGSTSDSVQDSLAVPSDSMGGAVGVYLSDYSPKDKPWDVHRFAADHVSILYAQEAEFQRLAARIRTCAGYLVFAWVPDCETGELLFKLQGACFCRVRHCPVCQWRRSMMWRAKFYQTLPKLQADYPKARWIFLTLTVRNCPVVDLRATLQGMSKSWKRLVKRQEFEPVLGFVRTTEVTRGDDGAAHPHFHCLLMVKSSYFSRYYVSQSRWSELWQECARLDYQPIVDVRAVKGDLQAAVTETLKYAVKPSDMQAGGGEFLLEVTRQVHKLRFVATGGALKDMLKPEAQITNQDMITADDGPKTAVDDPEAEKIGFAWKRKAKRYKRAGSEI